MTCTINPEKRGSRPPETRFGTAQTRVFKHAIGAIAVRAHQRSMNQAQD
jgi:hypothetical protein